MGTPLSEITGRPAWLLEVVIRGKPYRYTTAATPREVGDGDGGTVVFQPGMLPLSVSRQVGSALESVPVSLMTREPGGWAAMVARGLRFEGARCRLWRHYVGQDLDQAHRLIRGRLAGASYGDESEPLSFSVERRMRRAGLVPAADMVVSADTWPVDPDALRDVVAEGGAYPVVYGQPQAAIQADDPGGATPGYHVERFPGFSRYLESKVLIAGHRVAASTVTIVGSFAGSAAAPVSTMGDALGRTVSYIDFSTLGGREDPKAVIGQEWAVEWTAGGGVPRRDDPSTAMTGAGEIIEDILTRWTSIEVDKGRMRAVSPWLDSYRLDFAITSPTAAWDFLRGQVASVLPMEWVEGRSGGYFLPWRLDAGRQDVVGALDATPRTGNVTRTGPVQPTGDEPVNQITLRYARSGQEGRPTKRLTIGPTGDDAGTIGSAWARRSQSWLADPAEGDDGIRSMEISTAIVQDDATASAILRQQIMRWSVVRRALGLRGGHELDRYDLGDIVTVTASDVSIEAEVAQIRSITQDDEGVTLGVMLLDNPADSERTT